MGPVIPLTNVEYGLSPLVNLRKLMDERDALDRKRCQNYMSLQRRCVSLRELFILTKEEVGQLEGS